MIAAVRRIWDNFRGGGEAAVTVPPMDGALRPNRRIEEAAAVVAIDRPDNLVAAGETCRFSSGGAVFSLDPATGKTAELRRFAHEVSALALGSDGAMAVGLDGGGVVIIGGPHDGRMLKTLSGQPLTCPTALLFTPDGGLLVAQGSATRRPQDWKRDLMERSATGSVWRVDPANGSATLLADRLAWPCGLALAPDDGVAVSESWRHRIVLIGGVPVHAVLDDLPGYPARLAPASGGGYCLAVFAPRNQMIEFVLREPEFRTRMMDEIDPDYWVAPSLKASSTFLEPLQGGAQKHLGMLKPWAPTRSYGLVVRLDEHFRPVDSFHSRADGTRHGITACVEAGGRLLAASKGGDTIVALDVASRTVGGH